MSGLSSSLGAHPKALVRWLADGRAGTAIHVNLGVDGRVEFSSLDGRQQRVFMELNSPFPASVELEAWHVPFSPLLFPLRSVLLAGETLQAAAEPADKVASALVEALVVESMMGSPRKKIAMRVVDQNLGWRSYRRFFKNLSSTLVEYFDSDWLKRNAAPGPFIGNLLTGVYDDVDDAAAFALCRIRDALYVLNRERGLNGRAQRLLELRDSLQTERRR